MTIPSLLEFNRRIQRIPPLPQTVVQALDILSKPLVNLRQLERVINQDTSLVATVLRVANSPFYGLSRQIFTIKDASVLLGTHTLRHIITASSVINHFPPDKHGKIDHHELWEHAVKTAIAAKFIARLCRYDQEIAFICGLLHDLGTFTLDLYFPEVYEKILCYGDENNCSFLTAETAILGFNHGKVGGLLAEHWRLPAEIVMAIEYHHTPKEKNETIVDIVHVANVLAHRLDASDDEAPFEHDLSLEAARRVSLPLDEIDTLLSELRELVKPTSMLG